MSNFFYQLNFVTSKKRLFIAYLIFLIVGLFFVSFEMFYLGNLLVFRILENTRILEIPFFTSMYFSPFLFSLIIRFLKNLLYAFFISFSKKHSIIYAISIILVHFLRIVLNNIFQVNEIIDKIVFIVLDPLFTLLVDFGFFPILIYFLNQKIVYSNEE